MSQDARSGAAITISTLVYSPVSTWAALCASGANHVTLTHLRHGVESCEDQARGHVSMEALCVPATSPILLSLWAQT